ncbi:hypothetical protein L1987_04601 [Smallanthus sonchifolius]|uniref:Uncharacterized protein n=1 Tax=Smallanthus sonchifolius TaxID=185202 RepID=A0ACB9JT11_9ASTR|nr:hypothetical protein L1987_04601 [Smallanthus sonchifolius]
MLRSRDALIARHSKINRNFYRSYMEAMKMIKLFAVMALMMMAVSVTAADAPAPAPTSDATTVFVPTAIASLSALIFAFLF